jgi:hypothetical protein
MQPSFLSLFLFGLGALSSPIDDVPNAKLQGFEALNALGAARASVSKRDN